MRQAAQSHLAELLRRYPALTGVGQDLDRAANLLIDCYRGGGKALVCGNGGSAADAEHIAGELLKGFRLARPIPAADEDRLRAAAGPEWLEIARRLQGGLAAVPLAGHLSLVTAVMNDTDPAMIFAQQVYALGRPGDVVLGLSTSGNARSVIRALLVGKAFGLTTIGLCGADPARMDEVCDCVIHVPERDTHKVQELHLPVYHALCLAVEEEFFGQT